MKNGGRRLSISFEAIRAAASAVPALSRINGEFVTAGMGESGRAVQTRVQTAGNHGKQIVSNRVAKAVIDELDAVEIDEQQGQPIVFEQRNVRIDMAADSAGLVIASCFVLDRSALC